VSLGLWEYFFGTSQWTGPSNPASTWQVWALSGVWGVGLAATSSGAAPATVANRKLISPTGFIRFNTIDKL
jgi:hypothetical protein